MAEPAVPAHPGSPPPSSEPAPEARKKTLLRWLMLFLKIGLAAGLLFFVLSTRLNESARRDLHRVFVESPLMLSVALFSFSLQMFLGAQRVRMLLRPHGLSLTYWNALRLTYLGAFFDSFMVTSVGGDAVKAVYLAREAPPGKKVECVSVLVLDRLLGLLGLLSLMVGLTLLHVRELAADPEISRVLPFLFGFPAALLVGTLMLLSRRAYNNPVMRWFLRVLPLSHFFDRAYQSMQLYRHRLDLILFGWLFSVVVHGCGVLTGLALINAMGQSPGFGPFLVAWFISAFASSFLPIGGVGTGQEIYNYVFLKIADVQNGWVLATAMQAVVILAKLPGLVAWLLSRETKKEPDANVPEKSKGVESGR